MRDLYAKTYGSDYSMGDPKESESKIDSSFETNIIENFYYGNNYTQGDDEYTGFEPYVYSCSSDKLQMEYQVITRIQRFEKKDEEGPRGIGTYWIIIEKLSLLPDAKAQLKYLRSSTSKKLSITYIEKIIRNFQLFVLEEDGSFSPEELNPVKKKEKKTAKSDRANDVADAKNDENRQKTAEEKTENSNETHPDKKRSASDPLDIWGACPLSIKACKFLSENKFRQPRVAIEAVSFVSSKSRYNPSV